MKYSICIDSIFEGMDSLKALEQVKAAGFNTFEFWHWQERDMKALAKKAKELELNCAGFCTTCFNLTDPAQRDTFLLGIEKSLAQAKKMGAKFLITQSGNDIGANSQNPLADHPLQKQSIIDGLKAAAPMLEEADVTLLLEPLNEKIDHPGIYLVSSDKGFEIIASVASPNIKLLFDTYHQQISEGDIIRRLTTHVKEIGHIHCAGNPGRHELDSGELDYGRVFKALDSIGYNGYAGIEYFPAEPVMEGLKRLLLI